MPEIPQKVFFTLKLLIHAPLPQGNVPTCSSFMRDRCNIRVEKLSKGVQIVAVLMTKNVTQESRVTVV